MNISTTPTAEIFFIPIDLESSLGRIEDDPISDSDAMECETVTNTCEQSPFEVESTMEDEHHHVISPYPIEGSNSEIKDRHRFTESVGKLLPPPSLSISPGKQVDWVPEDLEPVEDPGDDEFSLSSESLAEEDLEFEKIEDPITFWESGADTSSDQPNLVPFSISYSYDDAAML